MNRTTRFAAVLAALGLGLCLALPAGAQQAYVGCADRYPGDANKEQRLICFDEQVLKDKRGEDKRNAQAPAASPSQAGAPRPAPAATSTSLRDTTPPQAENETTSTTGTITTRGTGLMAQWNMDDIDRPSWGIQPYRLTYLLPFSKTSQRNQQPSSPTPGHTVTSPIGGESSEIKFQFSVKSEIADWDNVNLGPFDKARLWFGYTQQSNWQAYNFSRSSPFRENNYEPEIIATFGNRDAKTSPFKLVNVGLSHQSNGRSNPESRSWSRLYVQGGWEIPSPFWSADTLSVLSRGWARWPEKEATDDNPNIKSYVGRGDVVATLHRGNGHTVSLLYRNSLSFGANRGFLQLDWLGNNITGGAVRPYFQYTSGYGETLIDYYFRQWTVGAGFAFDIGR